MPDKKRKVYLFKNKTIPQDPYHDLFHSKSFEPIFVPLLRHEFINSDDTASFVESKDFQEGRNALIITSQRAIEALNDQFPALSKAAQEALLTKPIYTVGPASAEALKRAGYKDIRGGAKAGNGAILSDIIIHDQSSLNDDGQSSFESCVFFTGVTRRDIIPVKLTKAGIALKEIVVYRTYAVENLDSSIQEFYETEKTNSESAVLTPYYVFFSPSEADKAVEAVRKLALTNPIKIAAIGPTTEKYLTEKGIEPNVVARKPDPTHLVEGIFDDCFNKD